jgi:hypothetical protein
MRFAKVNKSLILTIIILTPFHARTAIRENVQIESINFISGSRTVSLNSAGLVRLNLPEGNWGSSDCRTTAADIIPEDTHLHAAALAAIMAGKTVRINIDSTVKPFDDVCKVDSIQIKK